MPVAISLVDVVFLLYRTAEGSAKGVRKTAELFASLKGKQKSEGHEAAGGARTTARVVPTIRRIGLASQCIVGTTLAVVLDGRLLAFQRLCLCVRKLDELKHLR